MAPQEFYVLPGICCLLSSFGTKSQFLRSKGEVMEERGLIESRSDLVSDQACAESSAEGAGLGSFLLWVGRHLTGGQRNQL